MADPGFHELWRAGRAHWTTPAPSISEIDPAAITLLDSPAGPGPVTENPPHPIRRPDGWPDDGRFVEPRGPAAPPHVFQGPIGTIDGYPETGRNAWRAGNDAAIVAAVNRHNTERKLYPGDAEFMTPKLMKSWMMEEAGGSRGAFERDPFQMNVADDWKNTGTDKQRVAGLRRDQVMTPESSADAALKWLAHRARIHRDEKDGTYRGTYWTSYEALRNYNANRDTQGRDPSDPSNYFHNRYAARILGRARE